MLGAVPASAAGCDPLAAAPSPPGARPRPFSLDQPRLPQPLPLLVKWPLPCCLRHHQARLPLDKEGTQGQGDRTWRLKREPLPPHVICPPRPGACSVEGEGGASLCLGGGHLYTESWSSPLVWQSTWRWLREAPPTLPQAWQDALPWPKGEPGFSHAHRLELIPAGQCPHGSQDMCRGAEPLNGTLPPPPGTGALRWEGRAQRALCHHEVAVFTLQALSMRPAHRAEVEIRGEVRPLGHQSEATDQASPEGLLLWPSPS